MCRRGVFTAGYRGEGEGQVIVVPTLDACGLSLLVKRLWWGEGLLVAGLAKKGIR